MTVIARRANPFGEIRIIRNRRTGAISYCQGGWYQSRADRFGVSLIEYIHALHGLVMQVKGDRVLVIGGAGGTLGSMLARAGKRVTLVDIDPGAFKIAREYFNLAPGVECRVAEGRRFLLDCRARFDAIVIDAYWRGQVPAHLCTVEFFALARRRLRPGGSILFNAIMAHDGDPHADRIGASMVEAGLRVRMLDRLGETHRNTIVLGGAQARWRRPRLLVRPDTMADEMAEELSEMVVRATRPCDPFFDGDPLPTARDAALRVYQTRLVKRPAGKRPKGRKRAARK
jgi:predicted O-methyltransferase YrrM